MVYIKRLMLYGFKSFGNRRITINFEKGLTVITGPNGSGKSNLIAALRFALGELSSHNLGAERLSDLIHDSSNTSFAKVSVTLDNSDEKIPLESQEVTISRKISKNGESEYKLNGRLVSRNEILTILGNANVRPSGFNIVPQGTVISIAEMDPSNLRKILDQVSGIEEYDKKKSEAEKELQEAEKNLAVAKAATSEVKSTIRRLEHEMNSYLRRKTVEKLVKDLKASELLCEIERVKRELSSYEQNLNEKEHKISMLNSSKEDKFLQKKEHQEKLNNIEEKLLSIENLIGKIEKNISLKEKEMHEINSSIKFSEERKMQLNKESERLRIMLDRFLKDKDSKSYEIKSINEKLSKIEDEIASNFLTLSKLESVLNLKKEELSKISPIVAEIKEKEERLMLKLKYLNEGKVKLKERINSIVRLMDDVLKEKEEVSNDISDISQKLKEVKEKREMIAEELKCINNEIHELRNSIECLEGLILKGENLINSTRELAFQAELIIRSYETQEKDFIELLKDNKVPGLLGTLYDLVSPKKGWDKALYVALGDWAKSIVIKDQVLAYKLAYRLASKGIHAKILTPLNIGNFNRTSNSLIKKVVFSSKDAFHALANFLSSYIIARDLQDIENALSSLTKAVIKEGIAYYPDGRIEVSLPHNVFIHELKKENISLKNLLKILEEKVRSLTIVKEEKISALKGSEMNKIEKEATISHIDQTIRSLMHYEERLNSKLKQLEDKFDSLKGERLSLESEVNKLDKDISAIKNEVKSLRESPEIKELKEIEANIDDLNSEIATINNEISKLNLSRSHLKVYLEGLKKESERIEVELQNVKNRLLEIEDEIKSQEKENNKSMKRLGEIKEEIIRLNKDLDREKLTANLLRDERNKVKKDIEETEHNLLEVEDSLSKLLKETSEIKELIGKKLVELEVLKERLSSLDSSNASAFLSMDRSLRSHLISQLDEELKEISIVNQLSPEQYRSMIPNYKVRSKRIAELEQERHEIIKLIERIENEKLEVFTSYFNRISSGFNYYFNKLTGGNAWLKFEKEDNLIDSGIEMIVQFPGKPPRISRAASGGEKSVAVVALLMALQGLTPASFYVFDEVDAHMDASYTKNLANLFQDMAKKTQLIVVSLKDVVAEKADQLIGVFNRGGASFVVKTNIKAMLES